MFSTLQKPVFKLQKSSSSWLLKWFIDELYEDWDRIKPSQKWIDVQCSLYNWRLYIVAVMPGLPPLGLCPSPPLHSTTICATQQIPRSGFHSLRLLFITSSHHTHCAWSWAKQARTHVFRLLQCSPTHLCGTRIRACMYQADSLMRILNMERIHYVWSPTAHPGATSWIPGSFLEVWKGLLCSKKQCSHEPHI